MDAAFADKSVFSYQVLFCFYFYWFVLFCFVLFQSCVAAVYSERILFWKKGCTGGILWGGVEKKKRGQSWSPTFFPWVICKHSAVSRTVMSDTVRDARSKRGHVLINIITSQAGWEYASLRLRVQRLMSWEIRAEHSGCFPPRPVHAEVRAPSPARPTGEAAATRTTWKISARRRGSPHLSVGPPRFPSVRADGGRMWDTFITSVLRCSHTHGN